MRGLLLVTLLVGAASPALAQARERGYIAVNGGILSPSGTFTDRFTHTVNAEAATTESRYPSKSGVLFDGGAGFQLRKHLGVGLHVSHSSVSGGAQTDSQIPHPLFDDRDRQVAGDADDLSRTETAVHLLLYYSRASGPWRIRLGAGPSFFNAEQEVVTGVQLNEEYPYDTATFRGVDTARGKESAIGFNVGGDVSRMLTRRIAAGILVRFARANIDFNVDPSHRVSTNAGGLQAGAGLRFSF